MKTRPLHPARVDFEHPEHPGTPFAPDYGDIYHARSGALSQARQVFLSGNGLPARWQGRHRFVIFETGFGLGHNFLATWEAWRQDPQRCEQLVFMSVEKHPLHLADLRRAHRDSVVPELAEALSAQWPPLTPDLHTLEFEEGRVRLLLAWGDLADWRSELVAEVDAFYLDGFARAHNPDMWDESLYPLLARLAARDASVATWSVAHALRHGLGRAGFQVELRPGFGGKREMCCARYAGLGGRGTLLTKPPGRRAAPRAREALVIGAGLAGAAAARALLRDGLAVTVLERRAQPALETSGNPAGLFHAVAHAHDGAHAQLLRAAARRTTQLLRPLIHQGQVAGAVDGLLRGLADEGALAAMQRLIDQQGLPADVLQALPADAASALAGLDLRTPQCHYPGGGWVSPPELVRHWLSDPRLNLHLGADVSALQRHDDGRWTALDAAGRVLAEADVVVLANAHGLLPLLQGHGDEAARWPLGRRRGQITQVPAELSAGLTLPCRPLASGGYLIQLPQALGGGWLCGATSQAQDEDPALRAADQAHNLAQLTHLTGQALPDSLARAPTLPGRVGWRLTVDDRLPLVGPMPASAEARAGSRRQEQPREIDRVAGLYLLAGLGSRGLTLAPLLGEVLAAWISGAPSPVSASLLDAIDPARFIARAARRGPAADLTGAGQAEA